MNEYQPLIPIEYIQQPEIAGALLGVTGSSLLEAIQGKYHEIPISALAGAAGGFLGGKVYEELESREAPETVQWGASLLTFLVARKLVKWLLQ
jgi:hypothetical protein